MAAEQSLREFRSVTMPAQQRHSSNPLRTHALVVGSTPFIGERPDARRKHSATAGRRPVLSAEQARQRAALIIARVKAGEEPVPLPLPAKHAGGPTVADLAARYLEEHVARRCKPKTQRTARSVVDRHIVPALGKLGARQAAARRGRTPARHGTAREPVRDPRHGEHDDRDAEPHVCARQGLGHGARGMR